MTERPARLGDYGAVARGGDDTGDALLSVPAGVGISTAVLPLAVPKEPRACGGETGQDAVNRYVMIDVIGRKGRRPAMNEEVEDLVTTDQNGKAHTGYALTQAGMAAGDKRLVGIRSTIFTT